MFKIMGAVFVLTASSAFGFCLCEELEEKERVLKTLLKMMRYISDRIMVECDSLSEAFLHASSRMEEPYQSFLLRISERMDGEEGIPVSQIWQEETETIANEIGAKEAANLAQCMSQTGFSDKSQQMGQIDQYCKELQNKISDMEKAKAEKCKVYQALGIMTGILCVVILW